MVDRRKPCAMGRMVENRNNIGEILMVKALIASIVTLAAGLIGIAMCDNLPEVGTVVAISVMGAFIICFGEKRK